MIDDTQMNKITDYLIANVFRSDEIMYWDTPYLENGDEYTMIDVIASLHNLLYEAVKGKRYNYMFHWANKIGAWCEDDIFDEFLFDDTEGQQ